MSEPFPDMRDHVVLACAVGLACGVDAEGAVLAGADTVARVSALVAPLCAARAFTVAELVSSRLPSALAAAQGTRWAMTEARINIPVWTDPFRLAGLPVPELLAKVRALLA